jgi:hypothetical protein
MKKQHGVVLTVLLLIAAVWDVRSGVAGLSPDTDFLYVGDQGDNSVKRFNAENGKPDETFIVPTPGDEALNGPRALLIAGGELIVVNQNVDQPPLQPINGEVRQYILRTKAFAGSLVSSTDPHAPFVPRGAVLINGVLYVANFTGDDNGAPGEVDAFAGNGTFLGKLTPPPGFASKFYPRGVIYHDDLLYVSSDPNFTPQAGPGIGGQVLKFDPRSFQFRGVFIDDRNGGVGRLNRPEGLVFGPDDKLYITSFQATPADPAHPTDTDSIRIYDRYGRFLDKILLDQVGQPRAFAQALLFGPHGKLFVPISGNGPSTGEIREYDVWARPSYPYKVFVPVGHLSSPDYLTFGRTNPATLEYGFGVNLRDK